MNASTPTYTIGLDIAKSVFQVHKEDGSGKLVEQKKLRRSQMKAYFARQPKCLIGIEACGTAHYWGRELQSLGHEVRLIPAAYVKPFVRRNKTDARDAAAICTALRHPDMRFVRVKSPEQQAARGVERSRELLVKQHTQLCNSLRSQLAEHGIVAAQGIKGLGTLMDMVRDASAPVPAVLLKALGLVLEQIEQLAQAAQEMEEVIVKTAKADPDMRRLATIPGIGPITAHAIVTAIGDGRQFGSARAFAAWAGLTPKTHNSAGKERHKGISRQGEQRLRKLLALGASTVMRHVRTRSDRATTWQRGILARRPVKVAVLAQAARNARIAWAVLVSGGVYCKERAYAR